MGMRQIIQHFSWETIYNLPPSDILALLVLALLGLFLGLMALGAVVALLAGLNTMPRYFKQQVSVG